MKKIIHNYGDYAVGAIVVIIVVKLCEWFLTSGPLYEFVSRFVG